MTTLDSNVVARIRAELDRRIQSGAIAPGMAQRIGAELDRRSGRSAGPSLSQQMTAKMQASPDFYGQHMSNVGLGPLDVAGSEAAVPAPPPGWRPGTEPLNVTDVPIVGPAIRLTRAITETPNEALARQYATPQLQGASGFATQVARMSGGVLDPGGQVANAAAGTLEQGGSGIEAAMSGGVAGALNVARIPLLEPIERLGTGMVTRSAPDVVRQGVGLAARGAAAGVGLGEAQAVADAVGRFPRAIGEQAAAGSQNPVAAAITDEIRRLVEAQPEILTSGALGGVVGEAVIKGLGRVAGGRSNGQTQGGAELVGRTPAPAEAPNQGSLPRAAITNQQEAGSPPPPVPDGRSPIVANSPESSIRLDASKSELTPAAVSPERTEAPQSPVASRQSVEVSSPNAIRTGDVLNFGDRVTTENGRTLTVGPTLESEKVVLVTPEGKKLQRTPGEMEARGWVREQPARREQPPQQAADGRPAESTPAPRPDSGTIDAGTASENAPSEAPRFDEARAPRFGDRKSETGSSPDSTPSEPPYIPKGVGPPTPESGRVKEPWEMSREEFTQHNLEQARRHAEAQKTADTAAKVFGKDDPRTVELQRAADRLAPVSSIMTIARRDAVQRALEMGKTVPAEVLADYPDLAPRPEKSRTATPKVAPPDAAQTPRKGPTAPEAPAVEPAPTERPKADAPGYLDRVVAWAEAKSREGRAARPADRPGARFGGSEVNVYDVIAAAAKAVRGGVRTVGKVRDIVTAHLGREDPDVTRRAVRLIRDAERPDGTHDDARFEVGISEMITRESRKAPPVKATIRENTGQTANEPDTITQREALAGQLKAEAKGAGRVERIRAAQEKRDARRLQTAVGIERGAAEQSAAIQAGLAKLELSKQARKARIEMADERRKAQADRAAVQRDAAETLKATVAVGGDQRKAIAKALTDLPPEVRGRRDMLALVQSAETPADARRAALVIQKELHRQSIKDEIRSLESTRKRIKAIPRAMKTELAAKLGELNDLLKTLKTDWTMRDALAGKKKGQPIAVRGGPMLDQYRATSERARVAAGEIREKIEQALRDRRIMLGEQAKSAGYVTKMVTGAVKAIDKVASSVTWGRDRGDESKRAGALRWAFQGDWTVKTMSKVLDGTLGTKTRGYVEQLLFKDAVQGRRKYLGEKQKAVDTFDEIARKHGFRSWADLRDRAESKKIDVPWGVNEQMTMYQALALAIQDGDTKALTDLGARVSFSAKGDSAPEFNVDGNRRDRLAAVTDQNMLAAMQEAKQRVIEDQISGRLFDVLQAITGTTPPKIKDYFPRRARRISPESQNPAEIQQMDMIDAAKLADSVKLEKASFTKEREAGKNASFWIDNPFDVIERHVDRAAKIIHLAETVRAARRVFSDSDLRSAIADSLGSQTNDAIARHIDQMSLLFPPDRLPGGEFMRKSTRNITRALTQLNPRSIMRQYGSLSLATYDHGPQVYSNLLDAVKTKNRERMTNSNPALRERYENDTASAGIRAATGDGQKTAARARIIDREQLRLGARMMIRGDFREGNRRLWEAVKISNLPDSHVVTAVFLTEEANVRKEHPDWSPERVTAEAGERTADWVDDRMNTSDPNTMSRYQKAMRESGWTAPFAVFKSDRIKMWNLLLEARAADGGKIGKQSLKALSAIAVNAIWNTGVGTVSDLALGKELAWQRFGLAVAREMFGTSMVGDWVAGIAENAAATQGAFAGRASLLDNPSMSILNELYMGSIKSVVGISKAVGEAFASDEEEPDVQDFNKKEKRIEALVKTLKATISVGLTAGGVPLAPMLNDAAKLAIPSGDEFSRATMAFRSGDKEAAKQFLIARAKRMLKAGIPSYKIGNSFEATMKRRLEAPFAGKKDVDSLAEKAASTADMPNVVWEAITKAESGDGP